CRIGYEREARYRRVAHDRHAAVKTQIVVEPAGRLLYPQRCFEIERRKQKRRARGHERWRQLERSRELERPSRGRECTERRAENALAVEDGICKTRCKRDAHGASARATV